MLKLQGTSMNDTTRVKYNKSIIMFGDISKI